MKKFILPCLLLLSTPAIAETWAAQGHSGKILGPVVYAGSKEEAGRKATNACTKLDRVCAGNKPVIAQVTGEWEIFVHTCCFYSGGDACQIVTAVGGNAGRRNAYDTSVKEIGDAGYPNDSCQIQNVYGIQTGKKLSVWVE